MSLRLYFDEDAGHGDLLDALIANGFDVASAQSEGLLGLSDIEQIERAASSRRVLVTSNARDYHAIHSHWMKAGRDHAGIVIVQQADRLTVGERLRRFQRLQARQSPHQMRNTLLHLGEWLA